MTFSILGDSISTFSGTIPQGYSCFYPAPGYSVNSVQQMWWHLLQERMGWELVANNSYSGSRISKTGSSHEHTSAFIDPRRLNAIPSCDVLFVFGGTNDFGQTTKPCSRKRFQKACSMLLHQLQHRSDIGHIWVCTPIPRTDVAPTQPNAKGWTQNDLAQIIRNEVRRLEDDHIAIADLASIPIQAGDELLEDCLHPTARGMHVICDALCAAVAGD